jgi:serine/threonine protein kinase
MIVMDRVDGKSIWQLQEDKMPVPEIVARSVRHAIELLHENDIVFGDLRDPNILYDASKARVVLVDFDWSGEDGESIYPPHSTLATHVQRTFRHMVLCTKPMIYGNWSG